MIYSLGIDAGGTYTDAVLFDINKKIIKHEKSLTSYPNPIFGIRNVLNKFDEKVLKNVKSISISTTLSTNTILENTGYPVGLIIVGKYELPTEMPTKYYCIVDGGHNINGDEICKLDISKVIEFAKEVKDDIYAFAVSSIFSTRNSSHEIEIKNKLNSLFNIPVVCGHELSESLGAYDRAVTAYLNAQLIPITKTFIDSIINEINIRKINATILITKCDGSVVEIEEALQKPIETIFSGPAASLVGASFLSNNKNAIVIDIGGTSTDVAQVINGIPKMSEKGAKIGGWYTQIKAIEMETYALGGDSHVYIHQSYSRSMNINLNVGPLRVIPLCRALELYPNFKNKLKENNKPPKRFLCEFISPTTFFVRVNSIKGMSTIEQKHFNLIDENIPTSWLDIRNKLGNMPVVNVLKSLIEKRAIQMIGFTPTDASHVLKEISIWDYESSLIGSKILSSYTKMDEITFSKLIKEISTKKIIKSLMKYILKTDDEKQIENILLNKDYVKYSIIKPIILVGGPSKLFENEIKKYIDVNINVPSYSEVGNAIGAVVGIRMKIIDILITNFIRKENEEKIIDYYVYYKGNRKLFSCYEEAYNYAYNYGHKIIREYFSKINVEKYNIQMITNNNIKNIDISQKNNKIEISLKFIGTNK